MISETSLAGRFGVAVQGIKVGQLSPSDAQLLHKLLYAHRILVLRNQKPSPSEYAQFGALWGVPIGHIQKHRMVDGSPIILSLSNSPALPLNERDDAVHWHQDGTFNELPTSVTMVLGIETPDVGGYTLFIEMVEAYAALSESMKDHLIGLNVTHSIFGGKAMAGETIPRNSLTANQRASVKQVIHPIVITHPVTGLPALFRISGSATSIVGMSQEESDDLLHELKLHATQDRFRTKYKVNQGEILLWDTFSTMHFATSIEYSDEPGKRRLLHRISTRMPKKVSG